MILISHVLLRRGYRGNDAASIVAITPDGYDFRHLPRPNRRGGGVGILFKTTFHLCSVTPLPAKTFEGIDVVLQKLMEVIYRILNGLYPSYLNDIITVEELQHLRCRSRLLIPPFSTVCYGKKSLSYTSPVLWNSLGNAIKQCDVLTAFKKQIKLGRVLHVTVDSVHNAEYQTDDHEELCC